MRTLSKVDVLICFVVKEKISIPEIVFKILDMKHEIERREALEYHIERWETISSNYFRSFEASPFTNKHNYYSYILDGGKSYIYETDPNNEYYKETGVSYQGRDLLLSTIRDSNDIFQDVDILDTEKIKLMRYNDKYYGELSRRIMELYKQHK